MKASKIVKRSTTALVIGTAIVVPVVAIGMLRSFFTQPSSTRRREWSTSPNSRGKQRESARSGSRSS